MLQEHLKADLLYNLYVCPQLGNFCTISVSLTPEVSSRELLQLFEGTQPVTSQEKSISKAIALHDQEKRFYCSQIVGLIPVFPEKSLGVIIWQARSYTPADFMLVIPFVN